MAFAYLTFRGFCAMAREEAAVLFPYPDGENKDKTPKYSIGYGHSDKALTASSPHISETDALKLLVSDIKAREETVMRWFAAPPQKHEYDAIFAGYYQAGSKMKRVVDLINKGGDDTLEAMALFQSFNRDRGKFSPGLNGRRYREVRRYLKADYSDVPAVIPKLKLYRNDLFTPEYIDFPAEAALQ